MMVVTAPPPPAPSDAPVAISFVPSFKAARRAASGRAVARGYDSSRSSGVSRSSSSSSSSSGDGDRGRRHGRSSEGQQHEYLVSRASRPAEIRAMLNGLVETEQLEAAVELLSSYLAVLASPPAPQEPARRLGAAEEGLASIVLNACANTPGRMGLSREVMGAMRDHQVPLSTLSFCILIKGHGRNGDARRVKAAYEGMRTLGITPDLATINALVDAHVRTRRLPDAERLVAEMEAIHGVSPSARTFNTLLKGYALAGDMARAFATVRRLREAVGPGGPNEVTYSTLVHALVRTGDLRRARHLVTWMAKSDTPLAPDV